MHGRDQDPGYMHTSLAEPLGLADVRYVMPAAPEGSWYPGRFFDPVESLEPWLSEALGTVDDAVEACGLPVSDIVLAGFSQGACVVAEHVARRPARYRGVALLTGSLMGRPEEHTPVRGLHGLPVFVSASRYDEWIPLEAIEVTARAFAAAGADVSVALTDNTDHVITPQAVDGVRALLRSAPRPGPAR
jgi:phospholipase/carboxylesterase